MSRLWPAMPESSCQRAFSRSTHPASATHFARWASTSAAGLNERAGVYSCLSGARNLESLRARLQERGLAPRE